MGEQRIDVGKVLLKYRIFCCFRRVTNPAVLWCCWLGDRKDIWPAVPTLMSTMESSQVWLFNDAISLPSVQAISPSIRPVKQQGLLWQTDCLLFQTGAWLTTWYVQEPVVWYNTLDLVNPWVFRVVSVCCF